MREAFEKALHFRHACKRFDETKKIPQDDLRFVLEAGRLSPSSFGMEPWEFWVIRSEGMKEALRPLCWDQPQITTCSDLVVLLSRKDLRSTEPYVRRRLESKGADYERYLKRYRDFIDGRSDEEILCWAQKQLYLASGFMMLAAASIGIDSCPIEGFKKREVEALLDVDTDRYEIAYLIAFGYRVKPQQIRYRRDFDDIVKTIG